MDVIPFAVSAALVRLEHGYDQSGVAMAGVPAQSPRPPWLVGPAHPPKATVTAVSPVSPELAEAPESAVAPAVSPHMADSHQ